MINRIALLALSATLIFNSSIGVAQSKTKHQRKSELAAEAKSAEPVFWRDPGDIRSKDLLYGPGGKADLPKRPFTYLKEDTGGTTPKFDVQDANGNKWKGKLGVESQPETVATRLLWAVGYAANTNYLFPDVQVTGVAAHQKRGHDLIGPEDRVHNLRLQDRPKGWRKAGEWSWRDKRFRGRRDFNGLRVMMALLSNWDLKDENNMILMQKDHPDNVLYGVSDLGATFGNNSHGYNGNHNKNNLPVYESKRFVSKVTDKYVDFNFPGAPNLLEFIFFEYGYYFSQWRNHWIGRHIPIQDVRWITGLLSQLSPQQIRDAFRAANYSPEETERAARALEKRIEDLKGI